MAFTPNSTKVITAADFHADLTVVPGKLDIARKVNESAIKESIKNIVLTNKGERPFNPNFGCDIRKILFENVTTQTINVAKTLIREAIETYESRCTVLAVDITGDIDSNAIQIDIVFQVINNDNPTSFSIILNRVR
jgi:phage baseplate assembly protein W